MSESTAKTAGRGGIAIAVAKISFVLLGFIQQLIFPRVLDEAGYGSVSRMLAVVSIVNNVVVATSLQGVSRMVAGAREGTEDVAFRQTLRIHAVLALLVSTTFAALAGVIADWIEAPHAAAPLRIAAGVVLCYGVYAPLVGALNGRRRFVTQAGLDIFYGVSRTIAMTVGAWAFAHLLHVDGAIGAATGFVAAALLIVPIAVSRTGIGKPAPTAIEAKPSAGDYLRFLLPLIVAQAGLNLLLQTDLLLLSEAAGEHARTMGLDAKEADKLLAPYRAVQLFGFLPYQLLMSVQFVLFPLLAKASAENKPDEVTAFTRQGMRLAFVLTGAIAGTIAALGPHVLRFAFPQPIADGGAPFVRMYVLALSSLAILGVASAALVSLRKERWSVLLTWITVGAIAGAIVLTRPSGAFGGLLLFSTARASAIGMVLSAIVAAFLLRKAAGGFAPPLAMLRVALATGVVMALGFVMPLLGKLFVPVQAGAL
ncbi:MAG: lipopolysaccharide biosynthesis protein, partial [Myxococcales bacterium]|nr:lipopolysaccharide biosynthesis protein [Myxococcales bacterium]